MRLSCCACLGTDLIEVLNLGEMPPVNDFRSAEKTSPETSYPLRLQSCRGCGHLQLADEVSPDLLFRNYHYQSSASRTQLEHFQSLARRLQSESLLKPGTRVLEIGANDGGFIKAVKRAEPESHCVGVDPALNLSPALAEVADQSYQDHFSNALAQRILAEHGPFDLIIGLNVFAHSPQPAELVEAARRLMTPGSTLVIECAYSVQTIFAGQFDTIYHEHQQNFSLQSLSALLNRFGLGLVQYEIIGTQGASIRAFAQKLSSPSGSVKSLPEENKTRDPDQIENIRSLAESFKRDLRAWVQLRKKPIVAVGASARGMVILNYCQLSNREILAVIDDGILKIGKRCPQSHIPVISWTQAQNLPSVDLMLLSWNYLEHLLPRISQLAQGMSSRPEILVPFPKMRTLYV